MLPHQTFPQEEGTTYSRGLEAGQGLFMRVVVLDQALGNIRSEVETSVPNAENEAGGCESQSQSGEPAPLVSSEI